MPGVLAPVSYEPIKAVRVLSSQGNSPQMIRELEDATQTFLQGVPTKLVAGYLQECDFVGADIVYGVSSEHAHNLTTAGTAQDLSEAAPPNQPSGITTPVGAWIRDGRLGVYGANGQTVFSIALKVGQTFSQALLVDPATLYGLTKDGASGFWYLDTTDTAGNNAVAILLGVDPSSPNSATDGTRVFFMFAPSKRFFI